MNDKVTQDVNNIMNGTYAQKMHSNIGRSVNGGIIGAVSGVVYAWYSKSSVIPLAVFGFIAGASIAGILFPKKQKVK